MGVTQQGHPAGRRQSLLWGNWGKGGGRTGGAAAAGEPAHLLMLPRTPVLGLSQPWARPALTAPVLSPSGSGRQGEETLPRRLSGDREVPTGTGDLCGRLPPQQPLGTGQDRIWSKGTGQNGGGLCEYGPLGPRVTPLPLRGTLGGREAPPALSSEPRAGVPDAESHTSRDPQGPPPVGFRVVAVGPFLQTAPLGSPESQLDKSCGVGGSGAWRPVPAAPARPCHAH